MKSLDKMSIKSPESHHGTRKYLFLPIPWEKAIVNTIRYLITGSKLSFTKTIFKNKNLNLTILNKTVQDNLHLSFIM